MAPNMGQTGTKISIILLEHYRIYINVSTTKEWFLCVRTSLQGARTFTMTNKLGIQKLKLKTNHRKELKMLIKNEVNIYSLIEIYNFYLPFLLLLGNTINNVTYF